MKIVTFKFVRIDTNAVIVIAENNKGVVLKRGIHLVRIGREYYSETGWEPVENWGIASMMAGEYAEKNGVEIVLGMHEQWQLLGRSDFSKQEIEEYVKITEQGGKLGDVLP